MNKKFWYLTKLSFNKKVKSKWFIITNIILLVAIVALLNISSIIEFFGGDFESKTNIIVVDNADAYDLFNTAVQSMSLEDYTITESLAYDETEKLKDDELLVILNPNPDTYLEASIISNNKIDNMTYQSLVQALNQTKTTIGMASANIDPEILANISASISIDRKILNEESNTDENMDMIMSNVFPTLILPFFMLIIFLVQMVGGEICEEKTTRSMEIIIANVSPASHLLSKVLASNLFVILQSILLIIYCVIAYLVSMMLSSGASLGMSIDFTSIFAMINDAGLTNALILVIPIALIMIILSFVSYALVAGILASMTVNIEDFNQLQTPIMLISLAGYYLAVMAAMFDGSIFIRIISYIPFLSVFVSPTLFILGQITIIDMLISVAILILFIYFLLKFGLKVYKTGILNYSSGKVWKKLFNSFKN